MYEGYARDKRALFIEPPCKAEKEDDEDKDCKGGAVLVEGRDITDWDGFGFRQGVFGVWQSGLVRTYASAGALCPQKKCHFSCIEKSTTFVLFFCCQSR